MGWLLGILEGIYHLGTRLLYGASENSITARTIIIGLVIALIGYPPLTIATFSLAIYIWLFSMLHPSLREISGLYLGMAMILGIILGAGMMAG